VSLQQATATYQPRLAGAAGARPGSALPWLFTRPATAAARESAAAAAPRDAPSVPVWAPPAVWPLPPPRFHALEAAWQRVGARAEPLPAPAPAASDGSAVLSVDGGDAGFGVSPPLPARDPAAPYTRRALAPDARAAAEAAVAALTQRQASHMVAVLEQEAAREAERARTLSLEVDDGARAALETRFRVERAAAASRVRTLQREHEDIAAARRRAAGLE
jgi:hypothetical protein